MYFVLLPFVVLAVVILMVLGIGRRHYWAIYVLNGLWLSGLVVAAYFTVEAWKNSAYSENWAMYGVIFYVWPYSLFVTVVGGIELILLRRDTHPHARRCKLLTSICIALLLLLSVSAFFAG